MLVMFFWQAQVKLCMKVLGFVNTHFHPAISKIIAKLEYSFFNLSCIFRFFDIFDEIICELCLRFIFTTKHQKALVVFAKYIVYINTYYNLNLFYILKLLSKLEVTR